MKSFDHYKEMAGRGVEEVFGTEIPPEESMWKNIGVIADPQEHKFQKFTAFLRIAKGIVPDFIQEKYRESLYDTSKLPFNFEGFSYEGRIGMGGENYVFLFESKEKDIPSFVFKVDYRDSSDTEDLLKTAKKRKNEYEWMKEQFSEMPDLIPEEHFLITENPKKDRRGIVASVQKFMGHDIRDFLSTPLEDIRQMCEKNRELKMDIKKFASINAKMYEEGNIIDLLGRKNVVCVKDEGGREKLIFLDPHVTFSGDSNKTDPHIFEFAKERLVRLLRIAEEV